MEGDAFGYKFQTPAGLHKVLSEARNASSQCCDLFGEFSRYVAPAYHHDRCERSVQMRLYSMHKREFVVVFVAFFACFGIGAFIGLAGPPILTTTVIKASTLSPEINQTTMATGTFLVKTPLLTSYHQQLWLVAQIITHKRDDETFDKPFQVSISMQGSNGDPEELARPNHLENRTRHLFCEKDGCNNLILLQMGYVAYSHYVFSISFSGLQTIHERYTIEDVIFHIRSFNPSFTKMEIWFRFLFLITTFIVSCVYFHNLRKYFMLYWSMEQKWLVVLLPLLVLYNGPFFPLVFLVESWFPKFFTVMCQTTFLSSVLLCWLCTCHGLRQTEKRLFFYFPKLLIVGTLWIAVVVAVGHQEQGKMFDPTYNVQTDAPHYYGFTVFLFVLCAMYLAYLIILGLRTYAELRAMPFFSTRLKFMTAMAVIVLITMALLMVNRFDIDVLFGFFNADYALHYSNARTRLSYSTLCVFYRVFLGKLRDPLGRIVVPGELRALYAHSLKKSSDALSLSASDEGSEDESDEPNDITQKQMPVLSRRGSIKDKAKFQFCPCCKAVFRRQEAFICHIESTHTKKSGHKGDKIYVCPLCPYATVYSSNVKKHMRRMHPNEMLAEAEAEERADQAKAANGKGKPSTGVEITAQNPGTRTCKYCLKTFETQQHMASHVYHVHMRPT
nr:EOG090X03I5 [Triops cancriformis]